jgi:CDP-glucose 4,6-dehydratase
MVSVWDGRRVFVTGHTGFVGSWLCTLFHAVGADVVGYSLSDDDVTVRRTEWLARLGVLGIRGDVRDLSSMLAAIYNHEPDLVVHLAAQPILRIGFSEPYRTFDVNINGSLNVLEAVRKCNVPALVHVTSDKCYAPAGGDDDPITEASEIGGSGPYPASKTIAEILFREFNSLMQTGTYMATVRLGNVIGGGDEADRLVPNALQSFRVNEPFRIRDPHAVRPFQHVLDVVRGIELLGGALLARNIPTGLPLNFAPPGTGSTTKAVVMALADAWGEGAQVSEEAEFVNFQEQQIVRLDGTKASRLLGWEHRLDLAAATRCVVRWTRDVDAGNAPEAAYMSQTSHYLHSLESDDRTSTGERELLQ